MAAVSAKAATEQRPAWLAPLLVAAVAFAAHARGLGNGFTNWDDPAYVLHNPLLRETGVRALVRPFTQFYNNDYYPLNQVSYVLDHALWGLEPVGYHLTNILLHALAAALALLVARRLLGAEVPAILASLVFAVHPVNVESVAWVAERKNVLSMVFLLASFLLYLERDRREELAASRARTRLLLLGSLVAFVAAALAKTIVTPFPLVLVAHDVLFARERWRRRLLEKVPFVVVSAAAAVFTVLSQGAAGAIPPFIGRSALNNLWTMLGVYVTYVRMFVWPLELNARYASTHAYSPLAPRTLAGIVLVLALAFVAWRLRRRSPLVPFSIAWCFLLLLPVSHIVPTSVLFADRYLYYPTVALGWLVALGASRLARIARPATVAMVAALLVVWSGLTVRRTGDWKDSITLWESSVAVDPDNFFAHTILGDAYARADRIDDAIREKERGMELAPNWRHSRIELANTGFLHLAKGNLDRAEAFQRRARRGTPLRPRLQGARSPRAPPRPLSRRQLLLPRRLGQRDTGRPCARRPACVLDEARGRPPAGSASRTTPRRSCARRRRPTAPPPVATLPPAMHAARARGSRWPSACSRETRRSRGRSRHPTRPLRPLALPRRARLATCSTMLDHFLEHFSRMLIDH